jgi:hypothetical protein
VADQGQPALAVTATSNDPPAASTLRCSGEIANVQAPSCVTLTTRPATVIVPVRAAPADAPTWNETSPVPLPLAPDTI